MHTTHMYYKLDDEQNSEMEWCFKKVSQYFSFADAKESYLQWIVQCSMSAFIRKMSVFWQIEMEM